MTDDNIQEQSSDEEQDDFGTTGIDKLYDDTRKPQEIIDRVLEIQFNYIQPSTPILFNGTTDQATKIVIQNQQFYNTLCSLYTSRRILELTDKQTHIAESQKLLAEQQTKIAERQEEIAKGIKTSVDDSTNVAKSVRLLTIFIGFLTLINVIAAVVVCFKK